MSKILEKGQVVNIKNKKHIVIGMIQFKEDTWVWEEYKIKDEAGVISWLNIEEDDGITKYSVYKENYSLPNPYSIDFEYNNEKYSLFEKGTARVIKYFGSVDVDMGEKVDFKEFINESKNKIIAIENWAGEVEKSIGEYINESDIEITNIIEKVPISAQEKNGKITAGITIAVFVIPMIIVFFTSIFSSFFAKNKSISKFLEKDSNFKMVTSVTNNENDEKATVYETSLSIDEATKKIIDGIPESIQKVTQASSVEEGVGIFTKKEYAYVYKSENNTTYVQVSKNKFVTTDSNSYKARYRTRGYYRTYRSTYTNSTYNSYLSSAKQQSINARKSSGGGTSSGK